MPDLDKNSFSQSVLCALLKAVLVFDVFSWFFEVHNG